MLISVFFVNSRTARDIIGLLFFLRLEEEYWFLLRLEEEYWFS